MVVLYPSLVHSQGSGGPPSLMTGNQGGMGRGGNGNSGGGQGGQGARGSGGPGGNQGGGNQGSGMGMGSSPGQGFQGQVGCDEREEMDSFIVSSKKTLPKPKTLIFVTAQSTSIYRHIFLPHGLYCPQNLFSLMFLAFSVSIFLLLKIYPMASFVLNI